MIFREQSGQKPAAQIKAFTDTWHWDLETDRAREETLTSAPERVATPTPGVSAPGLWSETPSALDIPEAGEDDLAALDDADNGLE